VRSATGRFDDTPFLFFLFMIVQQFVITAQGVLTWQIHQIAMLHSSRTGQKEEERSAKMMRQKVAGY
jgi:hypothetical protein